MSKEEINLVVLCVFVLGAFYVMVQAIRSERDK